MSKIIDNTNLGYLISKIKAAFVSKTDVVQGSTVTLADVATSGDYDDLLNKPTIPDVSGKEDASNKRTSWQSTPDDTHYPSEKLVKDSLDGKQATIDSSHKLDYSLLDNTPTIPTVPTISTDIEADKASNTKTASPKAVYDGIHPAVGSSQPSGGFAPNVVYDLGSVTGTVTFSLATPSDANIANHYYWTFDTGSTAPTITWPSGISWVGSTPSVIANKHYDISIMDGVGVWMEA